jgi:uracil-DNA glycosylase family 4
MLTTPTLAFDSDCRDCPRLASFLDKTGQEHPDYHARPVAPFGDHDGHLLIVGLAPGMHGANATGRPFTGDFAGILLYKTLYDFGFSNKPESVSLDDGLELVNCRITNAVKCLPPRNKPQLDEIRQCNGYLKTELDHLPDRSVIIGLGKIAHDAVLRAYGLKLSGYPFGHVNTHQINTGMMLVDSYHCSRYNTQTRRLTPDMFNDVFRIASELLDGQQDD